MFQELCEDGGIFSSRTSVDKFDCKVAPEQSGSPIWIRSGAEPSQQYLVGVLTYYHSYTIFGQHILDDIKGWADGS